MKQLIRKSTGLAIGLALVAPFGFANAPSSVNGSLGGFSANAQGGQSPGDWGIPQGSGGQPGAGQASNQSGNGNGQNNPSGNGQNVPSDASQGKGPDAGGYGNGQNVPSNGGQNGPGQQQNSASGDGHGEHYDDGPTKNNSNNPDGNGSGHGEHYDDGPTKNNSNNPDGGDRSGSAQGDGHSDGGNSGNRGNSGGRGNHGGSGSNDGSDFPPLDPSDNQYDPGQNDGGGEIPSGCADAGSQCAQCVESNERIMKFNRHYLHVAWSVTHQTLEMTKQAIALGDSVSGIHSTQGLAWQLAGKPQIVEAVHSLRKTYDTKYTAYINNMEQALTAMSQCETDNYAVHDLYTRFSSLYLDFVKARYASPD